MGPDSPAYKQVEIEGVPHHMMIISSTVTNQKIIRTLPGDDFEIGKIMLWSKSHWLITERDADDEITVRGKIELCNRNIQWQDDETGETTVNLGVVNYDPLGRCGQALFLEPFGKQADDAFEPRIPDKNTV